MWRSDNTYTVNQVMVEHDHLPWFAHVIWWYFCVICDSLMHVRRNRFLANNGECVVEPRRWSWHECLPSLVQRLHRPWRGCVHTGRWYWEGSSRHQEKLCMLMFHLDSTERLLCRTPYVTLQWKSCLDWVLNIFNKAKCRRGVGITK